MNHICLLRTSTKLSPLQLPALIARLGEGLIQRVTDAYWRQQRRLPPCPWSLPWCPLKFSNIKCIFLYTGALDKEKSALVPLPFQEWSTRSTRDVCFHVVLCWKTPKQNLQRTLFSSGNIYYKWNFIHRNVSKKSRKFFKWLGGSNYCTGYSVHVYVVEYILVNLWTSADHFDKKSIITDMMREKRGNYLFVRMCDTSGELNNNVHNAFNKVLPMTRTNQKPKLVSASNHQSCSYCTLFTHCKNHPSLRSQDILGQAPIVLKKNDGEDLWTVLKQCTVNVWMVLFKLLNLRSLLETSNIFDIWLKKCSSPPVYDDDVER